MSGAANGAGGPQAWVELTRRIARFGGLFGIGLAGTALLGFATIAVLTRALEPSEYGRLAVLLVFSGFLTVIINLLILPGVMSWVFGGTGEDDAGLEDAERKGADDPQRAVCTGIAMTLGAAVVAVLLTWALSDPLGELLAEAGDAPALVVLAALSAAPASMVRVLANVMRYGHRPVRFVVTEIARPLLVLAGATLLLATSGSVESALTVYVVAGFGAVLVGAVLIRRDVRLAMSRDDARMIIKRSRAVGPAAFSNWTILNSDAFFLSLFASSASVGTYRVATGVSRLGAYAVSLFMRSWGPLTTTPLAKAVEAEHGRARTAASTLEYFVIASVWLLVGLAAFADVLVRIAPAAYSDAAVLVPVLASVFVLRGTFVMAYHGSERQDRRKWLFAMFGVAVAVFILSCVTLIPAIGSSGAALAGVNAFGLGTVVMLVLAQRGPIPMPLNWIRLAGSLVIGGALYGVVVLARSLGAAEGYAIDTAVVLAYPLLLVAFGLVPRAIVRPIISAAAALVPLRRTPRPLRHGVNTLAAEELELLDRLVRRREPLESYAGAHGEDEAGVRRRLVELLARLAGLPDGTSLHEEMGRYVLEDQSVVHHAALGRQLIERGHDAYALDALHETAKAVRAIRGRAWPAAAVPLRVSPSS